MFQKGTGERFKYKAAVKEKFPKAKCVHRYNIGTIKLFVVRINDQDFSSAKRSAEEAWADTYCKHVKPQHNE